MHPHYVRVGQVVFRRKTVRRIDEKSHQEGRGGQERQAVPVRHAAVKGGDGQQQHQRIHGQQIARQQRAAQYAEEQGIDQKQKKNAQAGWRVKRCAGVALGVRAGIEQQRGEAHQHRHKDVHVRGRDAGCDGRRRPAMRSGASVAWAL